MTCCGVHKLYMHSLYIAQLTSLYLSSYPLTSGITTDTVLSDSKLQRADEYQMSRWKARWEYVVKRKYGLPLSPTPFQVQSHIS